MSPVLSAYNQLDCVVTNAELGGEHLVGYSVWGIEPANLNNFGVCKPVSAILGSWARVGKTITALLNHIVDVFLLSSWPEMIRVAARRVCNAGVEDIGLFFWNHAPVSGHPSYAMCKFIEGRAGNAYVAIAAHKGCPNPRPALILTAPVNSGPESLLELFSEYLHQQFGRVSIFSHDICLSVDCCDTPSAAVNAARGHFDFTRTV